MPNSVARRREARMKKTINSIVFDWNCTLLDDFGAMIECMNLIMAEVGHPPITAEFFRTHYDVPFERLYRNFGFKGETLNKVMELDRDFFHRHYEPMAERQNLRPGAKDIFLAADAHGVETIILSNHIVDPIKTQLNRLGIHHHFTEVLAYADLETQFVDMTKGERLRRHRAQDARHHGEALIVGDSIEEIEIAHEQNLISVAITGGCVSETRLRAAKPDYVIHSLHELAPIMRERGLVP